MTLARLLPLFFVGNLLSGCASASPSPIGTDRQEIIGGMRDTNERAFVYLIAYDDKGNGVYACTGTVIAPRFVLTAAHCMLPSNVGDNPTFAVFYGDDTYDTAQTGKDENWSMVKAVYPDPAFDMSQSALGHDLGLVELVADAPVQPVPIALPLDQDIVGRPLRIVGYGETTAGDNGTTGVRYQATTTVSGLDDYYVQSTELDHRYCHGDSGGPALLAQDGQEHVIGVISHWRVKLGSPPCTGTALYTRVDASADFIASHLNAAPSMPDAGETDAAMPAMSAHGCSLAGSSHASGLGVLALALGALALGRRRRLSRGSF